MLTFCLLQISHTDAPMYILGYIQRDSRIYLADKDLNVTSFALSVSLLEYETFVLRGDLDAAAELLVRFCSPSSENPPS